MSFESKKKELFERLGESCYMVLATCSENYPLASTMTCVLFDDAIWMQTDQKFPKYLQMQKNPRVALCSGAVQIEGVASFHGHPLDEKNKTFVDILSKYHPDSYKMYSGVDTQVVIKVTPIKALDWLYEKGASELIHLDFVNKAVTVEQYKK